MGTEVLPPQDLLADGIHLPPASFYRRENLTHSVGYRRPKHNTAHRKKSPRPEKKRCNPTAGRRGTKRAIGDGGAMAARRKDEGPIMGQVVLLKRGEPLDSLASKKNRGRKSNPRSLNRKPADDTSVFGTYIIGPESPEMVPKQVQLSPLLSLSDVYAGSGFVVSPSPRSLPLPAFLNKKQQHIDGGRQMCCVFV